MSEETRQKGVRTWVEIDTAALAHNYSALKKTLPSECICMSVVKSNAYGHSLVDFSQAAHGLGIDWFGVDSIVEAMSLRNHGITKPILVLGYTLPEMLEKALELDVSITVSTHELFDFIRRLDVSKPLKLHIKVDTGMCRQGFMQEDVDRVMSTLKELEGKVVVEGLFTHFAAAKNPSFRERTHNQLAHFRKWVERFKSEGYTPIVHAAASGGTILFPDAHFDMVRIGIALYGLWPSKEVERSMRDQITLKPVLSWKTVIGEVKSVPKGSRVGYDATEELVRDSRVAVCPIGYWHGYPRSLSSIGNVLVRGKRARVVGRVSMDMITIDVTDIEKVSVLDEVVIIGGQGSEMVPASELADLDETSLYEIVTRINPLIKRVFV